MNEISLPGIPYSYVDYVEGFSKPYSEHIERTKRAMDAWMQSSLDFRIVMQRVLVNSEMLMFCTCGHIKHDHLGRWLGVVPRAIGRFCYNQCPCIAFVGRDDN